MKKFSFALDSLRRYRNTLFEQEQARLQALLLRVSTAGGEASSIAGGGSASTAATASNGRDPGRSVDCAPGVSAVYHRKRKRIGQAKLSLSVRIEEQKLALKLARRCQALEKLKERRFQAWRAEADREMEAAVAELVIGRFRRPLENGGLWILNQAGQ